MSYDSRARIVSRVSLCAALLAAFSLSSEANAKEKRTGRFFDDLVTPSMMAPAPAPAYTQVTTAKFFSINSVLAKLDGKAPADRAIRVASIENGNVASDAPASIAVVRPVQKTEEPFGLFTFRAPEGVLWRKWRSVKSDIRTEMEAVARCKADPSACTEAGKRFLLIAHEIRSRSGRAQIETANRLVNGAIRYMSDLNQHGAVDVWSAPLASLGSGRGDCEDYAIAKYVLLHDAGVREEDLRILLVRDRAVREDHAVLAVRNAGSWMMLDNRRSELAADSELPHFTPLYSLNEGGINLFASPYLSQRLNIDLNAIMPAADNIVAEGAFSPPQRADEISEFTSRDASVDPFLSVESLPILL